MRAILGGGRSIQSAWQTSPSANGHRIAFESERSPGYVAQMDTETRTSGFTRSIVMKAGLAPKDVLAGAQGIGDRARRDTGRAAEPTLIGIGLTLGAPDINQLPTAGTNGHVDLPIKIKNRKALPKGVRRAPAGIRSMSRSRPWSRRPKSAGPPGGWRRRTCHGTGRGSRGWSVGSRGRDDRGRATRGRGVGSSGGQPGGRADGRGGPAPGARRL